MRELNDAIVSSRKIKFEEFKEEDHKTTSVSSSEEELKKQLKKSIDPNAIENMKKWISWIVKNLSDKWLANHNLHSVLKDNDVPTACNLKYPIAEIRRRSLMEKYNKLKVLIWRVPVSRSVT
ncbi:hypothetical protein CUMW_129770 [Citrus unshiu]|nr:hypothetical protein CUMW_129770 [Citrus unshiu]